MLLPAQYRDVHVLCTCTAETRFLVHDCSLSMRKRVGVVCCIDSYARRHVAYTLGETSDEMWVVNGINFLYLVNLAVTSPSRDFLSFYGSVH